MEVGTFYTIPNQEYTILLEIFKDNYDLDVLRLCPNEELNLLPAKKRVCRFCFRWEPDVTFFAKAHVFPHQLGNEFFISDFECDSCNKRYSLYEADLSNYLGISKTLFQTKGKRGVPNFHSPQDIITAKKVDLLNGEFGVVVNKKNKDDQNITVDHEGRTTFEYFKNPYRPLNVYKILLKIALSCLSEGEILNYAHLMKILNDKKKENALRHTAFVFKTTLSFERQVTKPYAIILKKKRLEINVPTHCVLLYFNNIIFQIPIPSHFDDVKSHRQGNTVHFLYCPPLSPIEFKADDLCSVQLEHFCDLELKKDDVESWTLDMGKEKLRKMSSLNPNTGEIALMDIQTLSETGIKQVVFVPKGFKVTADMIRQYKGFFKKN